MEFGGVDQFLDREDPFRGVLEADPDGTVEVPGGAVERVMFAKSPPVGGKSVNRNENPLQAEAPKSRSDHYCRFDSATSP